MEHLTRSKHLKIIASLLLFSLLTACGGGGTDSANSEIWGQSIVPLTGNRQQLSVLKRVILRKPSIVSALLVVVIHST